MGQKENCVHRKFPFRSIYIDKYISLSSWVRPLSILSLWSSCSLRPRDRWSLLFVPLRLLRCRFPSWGHI
ncbi:hypothetical protein XELAEV_18028849mg [Xenopus laevis]|uniref:Uncharacterized protein n=1 Tax=Xenopus laevis TaxID=8355 RepID=A0A974CQF8_XENLA|nr:hypothetical protein XELAEV_18028849mg [Xenopus laevis]